MRARRRGGPRERPELRSTLRGAGALVALLALLVPASAAWSTSSLPIRVEGGHTFALPATDFVGALEGVSFEVEGDSPLPVFGPIALPISGGQVNPADDLFPFTGQFEHDGTTLSFSRGGDEVAFADLVLDTENLGVLADVSTLEDGTSNTHGQVQVFNLLPLLPALPPLPGLSGLAGGPHGAGLGLPTVLDGPFGKSILLDLLRATVSFETEELFADVLFDGPVDLAGRSAAFVGVAAELGGVVPEPTTGALLLVGLAGLGAAGRYRRGAP